MSDYFDISEFKIGEIAYTYSCTYLVHDIEVVYHGGHGYKQTVLINQDTGDVSTATHGKNKYFKKEK